MSIQRSAFVLLLTLVFSLTGSIQARIINVPDDFEIIQEAIDESEDGDTVLVQPGEYVENINFGGRAITVASLIITTGNEAYIDSTIIDGNRRSSVVRFDSEEDETSILTGFSITNGTGSRDIAGDIGGGGIMCLRSSPTLQHLKVFGNRALYGGGIMVQLSSPLIEFVSVYDNTAGYSGGGIYCSRQGCQPTISRSIIYDNNSDDNGGGLGCWLGASPVLEHVTMAFNRAGWGGGISTEGGIEHVRIRNTILWSNSPSQVYLSWSGDTLTVSYSDVQGGEDGVRHGENDVIIWGDGNIDDNPLFVDPEEDDFHLQEDSPCIDTGDPDSPEDPDGTRADMGACPFFESGLVEGFVLDLVDDEPLEDATVRDNYRETETDENGFFRFVPRARDNFDLIASHEGYNDGILRNLQVEPDDTLSLTFRLTHPEFLLSDESIAVTLDEGDSTEIEFNIRNAGNGHLEWQAKKKLAGEADVDPWELRRSFNAGEEVGDTHLKGVVFIEDRFYVSGDNIPDRVDSTNMIYILDRDGNLLDRFGQLGTGRYGMCDLTYDGELIWGSGEQIIYGFTTEGDSATSFEGPYNRNTAIAWDSDRRLLWISAIQGISALDRDGNVVATIDRGDLRIYGLAYWSEDPDGCGLYIFCNQYDYTQQVNKTNPDEGGFTFVANLDSQVEGRAGGVFITNQFDFHSFVFMDIANDGPDDRIDIWQVEGNTSWMMLEPVMGEIEAEASQDLTLSIFTEGLLVPDWEAELVFSHNAVGGETILPVTLTIEPSGVDPSVGNLPVEFGITSVYPNPFNNVTRIIYTLNKPDYIKLAIYDLTGRKVDVIDQGFKLSGCYSMSYNALSLPSGVYILNLTTTERSSVRKMLLIK